MANPSTTGPSGIGSEVLRRVAFDGVNGTSANQVLLTVGTDMIITVLSICMTECSNTAGKTITIYAEPDGSGTNYITRSQDIPALGTFVWNEKIVLTETDVLSVGSDSTNYDVWCSYIEQEFE